MNRLRRYFAAFLLLLAVPISLLLIRTYDNLEEGSFYFYRKIAEGLVSTLDQRLLQGLEVEQRRPYTQYRYIYVADQPLPNQTGLNLSPLAAFPVESDIPGILGYFQIDPDGSFHTPLLPDAEPAEAEVPDRASRAKVRDQMAALLRASPGVQPRDPRPALAEHEAKSRLSKNLASNADLRLENEYIKKEAPSGPRKDLKTGDVSPSRQVQRSSAEQALVFETQSGQGKPGQTAKKEDQDALSTSGSNTLGQQAAGGPPQTPELRDAPADLEDTLDERDSVAGRNYRDVEAEVDEFQVQLLDKRWLVFRRKVWWRDRRYVQGFVAKADEYLTSNIRAVFENSALSEPSCLVFHSGDLIRSIPETESPNRPLALLSAPLPHPFNDFTLAVTLKSLPAGPGYQVVNAAAIFLVFLVVGGCYGIYRFTAAQMELSQRKSDFVAAVSHELKTPLASIRMYGEMLVEGWVDDEEKKRIYYRHIRDESERLTRLIQNVLRLAELERNELKLNPQDCDPVAFVRGVVERLGKQIEAAGFEVVVETEGEPTSIWADPDALTQILINLIDNALKFSKKSEAKQVALTISQASADTAVNECVIRVRDFGPGIPKGKLNKIFEKFYRIDSEATRTTRGTGIGLALVKTLADAMGATVDVVNRRPGAEFRLRFRDRNSAKGTHAAAP